MKKLLLALLLTFFCISSAQAYFIQFDSTGSGNDDNLISMDEWTLASQQKRNTDLDEVGDLFTYQNKDTGEFTESFTIRATEGINSDVENGQYSFDNLYIDVTASGQYFSDDNIVFNDSYGTMYMDNNDDQIFTGSTDTKVTDFDYKSSLVSNLSGSLISDNDLQMDVDIEYVFENMNPDYFGDTEEELAGKGWLLALSNNNIAQEDLYDGTDYDAVDDNTRVIEWNHQGGQVNFNAVPEPTTMLLFGTGLLGLALYGRKRFINKS